MDSACHNFKTWFALNQSQFVGTLHANLRSRPCVPLSLKKQRSLQTSPDAAPSPNAIFSLQQEPSGLPQFHLPIMPVSHRPITRAYLKAIHEENASPSREEVQDMIDDYMERMIMRILSRVRHSRALDGRTFFVLFFILIVAYAFLLAQLMLVRQDLV